MKTNILDAIYNIVKNGNYLINPIETGRNRANNKGEALENFIKDAFANTFSSNNEMERLENYNKVFSWLGSQNNPPDIMIKNGDAIEVKKIENINSALALNSSYPKAYLDSNSKMITKDCRDCEDWTKKNLIYCVGFLPTTQLKSLWLVYGDIYSANQQTYERIKESISYGITTIPDIVFSETKELGRVNNVDPLGITNLRIRGMWQIENPRKVFDYLHDQTNNQFELVSIIPKSKYNSFSKISIDRFEQLIGKELSMINTKVKDPNNPAKFIEVKYIKYIIE